MSHLRDQFVGNADTHRWDQGSENTSRENLAYTQPNGPFGSRTRPYSPVANGPGQSSSNFLAADDFRLAPSANRYDTNVSAESYELSDVQKNPFDSSQGSIQPSPRPLNPFQNSAYPDTYGYSVVPEPAADGYGISAPDAEHQLEKHIRHHERNRRKLNSRLPRFHYTKLPWFTILVTTAQVIVFIVEMVKMGIWTGSPFQTKPYFNPMLGPSTYVLINMGARYVPCMHRISGVTSDTTINFACPNSTSIDTNVCNLSESCGLSGVPIINGEYVPSQYYRIVLPIFLHAGILHILFNMMLQLTTGIAVERCIGWMKYSIIYIASGVAGFLLGANFSPYGVASTGASGSLFGIIAANFLLFIYCGRKNTNIYETKRFKTFILIMVMEVVVSFVLGLLPGLDNFAHIGGFCMGILLSILLLPDPSFVYVNGVYTYDPDTPTWKLFVNNWNPLSNYENKVPWKIAVWALARLTSLALAIVYFVLLVRNLKSKKEENNEDSCRWCKYINCIPVNGWCDQGELTVSTSSSDATDSPTTTTGGETGAGPIFNVPTTTSTAKRHLLEAPMKMHSAGYEYSGAKYLGAVRSESGSVAFLVVGVLAGYMAVKKMRSKILDKNQRRQRRQPRRVAHSDITI